jgi:exopolyphosphatase / guanosine-5'-triphosphate,3'-diphosphate pyrophosphatase
MTIVPRWEWRTFGADHGRFASREPERVEESDESYLIAAESDASVKLRAELMDVKHLQAVNDDGLEQWMPVLKAAFPLSADDAGFVFESLGVAASPVAAASLGALLAASPDLRAVDVHKLRRRYTIDGCMAELTELRTPAGSTRTIAVESEDPERVIATVRELGFGSQPNVNMARGLKTLVGFGARRFAVIDVGTNSVKFHVGERRADGTWRTVADRAEVTRLGEGLDATGRLGERPIARTVDAIAGMADEAQREGAEAIAAVATAGMRIAPNSSELIDAVRERCGVEVEVIPGEEEARLAYRAATSALGDATGDLVVFDSGGGSSQFTFNDGEQFSVNVGAARFTERFGLDGPVSGDTLAAAREAIAADLERLEGRPPPDAIVGMGGAVTNLAAVKHGLATYDSDAVQGTVLDTGEIDRQIQLYSGQTAEQRRAIAGLQPNRAEVILAGALIVRTVLDRLGRDSFTVSDRGLRHGLLAERFAVPKVTPR